jgi:hypothetical protein
MNPELRDALSEQLSLYEEFEAVVAEDGSKGVQAAKGRQFDGEGRKMDSCTTCKLSVPIAA